VARKKSGARRRDCVSQARIARSRPMHSHEVMKEVLKTTSAKQIAAEMNLSLSLVYKWAEPIEERGGLHQPARARGQLVRITKDAAGGAVGVRAGRWFFHPQPAQPAGDAST
jgi:hypothetical protein